MKTIEEKAKAYDEALERAKAYHRNELAGSRKEMTEYIFPELRESEDERIRKFLIETFQSKKDIWAYPHINLDNIISWLERQKEQKKPTLDDPHLYGDWDKDLLEEIHSWLGHLDGKYTPYTIDDIKLTARHFVEWQKQKEQKPNIEICPHSTKSKSYKENGYPIEQNPVEWSEEDKRMCDTLIRYLSGLSREICPEWMDWLHGLHERFPSRWKPSEEQMDALTRATNRCVSTKDVGPLMSLYNDLKKLCQ